MSYPTKVLEREFNNLLTVHCALKGKQGNCKQVYEQLRGLNNAIIKLGGEDRSSDLIELTL